MPILSDHYIAVDQPIGRASLTLPSATTLRQLSAQRGRGDGARGNMEYQLRHLPFVVVGRSRYHCSRIRVYPPDVN